MNQVAANGEGKNEALKLSSSQALKLSSSQALKLSGIFLLSFA
jgi:hypothetical protein